ncbi:TonB-dependent siderophore receptor [Roseicella sp. DB1501]|uniref:TonB-dependent siderophore receptor n=1 Tax=Roseicella sp. DB1501 TaxID=2730925 RepID=UPI001492B1E4|nr:TonB-dependent receptor plug domain-containing protein [Roseicella sp. DB1501]NOG70885.1 TonB-dependent receptor plug domain-containing protein [Roseicella sp. DB1501]
MPQWVRPHAQPFGVLRGAIALSGLVLCGPSLAQTSGGTGAAPQGVAASDVRLPELNVTGEAETGRGPVSGYVARLSTAGTKTDTPLLETPQSLSVITRDQMDQQNVQTLNGAVRYTPGVTPETRGGIATRYDQLKVRGFDADTYWNGMKLPGNGWYGIPQLDPFLMERIEVLRGPVSVLYGQAAAGGLLNQESKRPTLEPLRQIGLQFGNFEHARGTFDFSGPLDADRVCVSPRWWVDGLA